MRILFFPVPLTDSEFKVLVPAKQGGIGKVRITDGESTSSSVYGVFRDLMRASEDFHLFFLARYTGDPSLEGMYEDADVPRRSWIMLHARKFVLTGIPYAAGMEAPLLPFVQWQTNKFPIPLDGVVTAMPFVSEMASLMLSSQTRILPALTRHDSSYSPSGNVCELWGRPGSSSFKSEAVMAGSLLQNHVFLSKNNQKNYFDLFFRNKLSATMLRELMNRSAIFRNGIGVEEIDGILASMGGIPGDRGRSVGSFYRLDQNKGTAEVLALYRKMAIAGQVDRVNVTFLKKTDIGSAFDEDKSVPAHFNVTTPCHRRQFIEQAAQTTVALWNSRNEAGPIAPVEAAAAGCIPVFPNRPWVQDMAADWPLVYNNMDQAHGLILKAIEEQDKYRAMARKWVEEWYDARDIGKQFLDHTEKFLYGYNKFRTMSDEDFAAFCKDSKLVAAIDFLAKNGEIAWKDLLKVVVIPRNHIGEPVVLCHHDLPALVERRTGLKDDLKGPVPRFVRV